MITRVFHPDLQSETQRSCRRAGPGWSDVPPSASRQSLCTPNTTPPADLGPQKTLPPPDWLREWLLVVPWQHPLIYPELSGTSVSPQVPYEPLEL